VRKVFHKTTGESFAAKSFHNVLSNRNRNKILRELGCLELCVHRNLITLVEAFELKDDPYTITIVMAPWAPTTLWNFLLTTNACRKAEFPWFEPNLIRSDGCIYRMMVGIGAAVAFLHERSIKHKDIKPQNILLYKEATGAIRPIVTDVGETKVYRAGTATDPKRSSYEYLAPEQQLETEDMQSSLKADIWQLGCCFALLLAVARSGSSGLMQLWDSFTNTAENASCNIANESVQFMATLHNICLPGSIPQEHAHWVVTRMLDKNPMTRFDIQDIEVELASLSEMADTLFSRSNKA
jgi:serine/threonine protein kinase